MIQYADLIKVAPLIYVNSVEKNEITMKLGRDISKFPTIDSVYPTDKPKDSDAGLMFNFNLKVAVNKLEGKDQIYYTCRTCILQIFKENDLNPVTIGSLQNPVKISVEPTTNYDILTFSHAQNLPVL